jgi:hypothetical protein
MDPLLDDLMRIKDVAALVDGGAASNVPVELAWRRVQDGRLGTRNACYFAWDCFHPQWDPKHLWLQPVTQAVQIQMVRNAPFADRIVQFSPTLSPVTLAASEGAIDRALEWGRRSVEPALPMIKRLMEPVWWEGDGPPPGCLVGNGSVRQRSDSPGRRESPDQPPADHRILHARGVDVGQCSRTRQAVLLHAARWHGRTWGAVGPHARLVQWACVCRYCTGECHAQSNGRRRAQ